MLTGLGVERIEMAASADEAIGWCRNHFFDLVLCDYNLGTGRTGQHVLEELRYRKLITRQTLFLIVSAESSRTIVMCAYDCEPDDFLMKPINARMLQQRMDRLLRQRQILTPVYKALDEQNFSKAMELLIDLSLAEDRHSAIAQKLLGSLFVNQGEFDKAEKLYTRALEVRQLDWARLGLARVKQARGELELAGNWLEKIVDDNPLFLPAYDVLAENWNKQGESYNVQFTVQRAVDISPMSILRQKHLASVARDNNDLITALDAQRRSVKLGRLSCHGRADDHFNFARLASLAVERQIDVDPNISNEALAVLDSAKENYSLSEAQQAQCNLLAGRIHALEKRPDIAEQFFEAAQEFMVNVPLDIDVEIDRVTALLAMNKKQQAEELLEELKVTFANDQHALEKLDRFLSEPASDSNREFVAAINHEGIELYNQGAFDDALACFERARKLFPKHVGIQLNIVQALIGKLKSGSSDNIVINECRNSLQLVSTLIDEEHPQFDRFSRLKTMANSAML